MDPFALRAPESYLSVAKAATAEVIIEKSRFTAYAEPVESAEAAEAVIARLKAEHATANHVCSAYIIGPGGAQMRASDDGEPSGTAGVPILEVLKKEGLTDCIVAVVRYFGGIKLGAGGLIRAYGRTTKAGIEAAGLAYWEKHCPLEVRVAYNLSGSLSYFIEQQGWRLNGQEFTDRVTYHLDIPVSQVQEVKTQINNLCSGQAEMIEGSIHYAAGQAKEV